MDYQIREEEIKSYLDGHSSDGFKFFGAIKYKNGYIFRVLAPNADRVFIKGDFNAWIDEELIKNEEYGYFYKYITAKLGDYYKYVIEKNGFRHEHSDPFAKEMDPSPNFATKIVDYPFTFTDKKRIQTRSKCFDKPLNIYEVHLSSWKDASSLDELSDMLISYMKEMNYTHLELLPITEHPYSPSWGYQVSGFFAMCQRYGNLGELKSFVNKFHKNNLGIILDFVPAHYASDDFALKYFDSTSMYESYYSDLQYSEWGSMNFDYSKGFVKSFMKSAINYWIEECHFDGIRFDAINNMIYYGGDSGRGINQNNIDFLKDLNYFLDKKYPSLMKIAEDSSSFQYITRDVDNEGLGFDYKWDLGWMNDTRDYFSKDSLVRKYFINKINFSMYYFYNERYILPLSHDEVVHLKKSMVNGIFGDYDDKFRQMKLFYLYQMTHPGKKLNFMGNELAVFDEWDFNKKLYWDILKFPMHSNYRNYVKSLNEFYLNNDSLYKYDYERCGFEWIVVDDNDNSVFVYKRISDKKKHLVVLNMTNVYQKAYSIRLSEDMEIVEVFNTFSKEFGGHREVNRKIEVNKGEILELELCQYEGIVFEILNDGK